MTPAPDPGNVVGRRMLTDEVYERLLDALMDGRLVAGVPVSIDGTARELAVSPTPVREALARLEATGLVQRVALKGYRVAPILTPEALSKLMDARRIIEPAVTRMAARHVTARFCSDLDRAIDDLAGATRGPSFAEIRPYWSADEHFHRLIAVQADNPFLLHAFESLGGQVQRFRLYGRLGVTDAEFAISEHAAVLAALKARDGDGAAAAMEQHLVRVRERALHDRAEKVESGMDRADDAEPLPSGLAGR